VSGNEVGLLAQTTDASMSGIQLDLDALARAMTRTETSAKALRDSGRETGLEGTSGVNRRPPHSGRGRTTTPPNRASAARYGRPSMNTRPSADDDSHRASSSLCSTTRPVPRSDSL